VERRRDREREIQAAVSEIRTIEERDGVTRASLERIKQRPSHLAARADLFPSSDFPPPAPGRTQGGPRETGRYLVKQGTGVCFMPEDRHSIHIQAPLVFPAHADIREAR
jgi:hypothetical protein